MDDIRKAAELVREKFGDRQLAIPEVLHEHLRCSVKPPDLVSVTSLRNPYFRDRVMRTRELLYAA
jgi:hypothetical protein